MLPYLKVGILKAVYEYKNMYIENGSLFKEPFNYQPKLVVHCYHDAACFDDRICFLTNRQF